MSRPFKLEVIIRSTTPTPDGGVDVQQSVPVEEYSDFDWEHVVKNFHVAKAVTAATFQAMEELAQAAGFVTELDKLPKANAPGKAKTK